jgi:serine/threonine protein kinase
MALASKGRLLAGRYRVLGRLGAGGMAVVVLAEDERLRRKVAVKRLHAESPGDAARRFQREAKVGASLNHPNIVAVYDTVADEEGVLIVMEYVDGHTLQAELERGPMGPERALEVLRGMAAALDHAHANGVVHRDVKPANVLIAGRDGTVKLTDLGIATATERTNITGSGMVLGTASYMAPERLDGHAGGPAVDVYGTAAVAFEMLSGMKAVTGRSVIEVARRVMDGPVPDLAEMVPGTPARASEVLKRGLAKDPAERPASVGDLVSELSAAYEDAAIEGPPTAATRSLGRPPAASAPVLARSRPRGRVAAAALALLAAAVVAIVLLAGSGDGGDKAAHRKASPSASRKDRSRAKQARPAKKPSAPAVAGAASPIAALTTFYARAASHDFAGAWALGTDAFHQQLQSLEAFTATVATLQSISFPDLRVTGQNGDSATVAFSSVAQHTDRADRCVGQASVVRQSGGWFVDHLDVKCAAEPVEKHGPKKHGDDKHRKPKPPNH